MSKKPKIDKRLDKFFKGITPEESDSKKDKPNVGKESPASAGDSGPRPIPVQKKTDAVSSPKPLKQQTAVLTSPEPVITQENENTTSTYSVNIQTGYQDWATLRVLDETSQRQLTPDEELLVKQVSDQLSLALENARLFQEAQKFKLGIDRTDNAVLITDPDGTIQYVNPGFEKIYGYTSEEALGKTPRILKSGVVPNEEYSNFWTNLLNKNTVTGDIINKTKDGRLVSVSRTNSPILDENGKILGFLSVHQDITDRKKSEEAIKEQNEYLAVLNEIMSLAGQTLEIGTMLKTVLEKILQYTGFNGGLITMFNASRGKLERAVRIGLPGQSPADPAEGLDYSLCKYIFNTQQELLIPDIALGAPADVSNEVQAGLHSYIGIPLASKGNTLGTLCLFRYANQDIPEKTISLCRTVSVQLGFTIENARLFALSQASEADLRALFSSMEDVVLVVDKDGRYVRIAPTNPSRLVRPPEELIGQLMHDVLPKETADRFVAGIQKTLNGAETVQLEYDLLVGDETYWFLASLSKLDEGNVFWVARDITERKKSEEAIKRRNEYLAVSSEIGKLVTSTLDLNSIFIRTVNLINERFHFYHAGIFIVEETGFNAVCREATGLAGAEMKERKHTLQLNEKSIVGKVTLDGQAVIVNDVTANPLHKVNPLLPETRAEAAIPLRIGNRVIGAIDIQSKTVGAFTDDDIAILQTLADQVAVAIDNARSFELSQQAVMEMREIDRLKSQFLANMSHELRTPLNSIIGFSRVIIKGIDGPVTELQQQDLTAIYNSGQHLLGLINDVLDLSKIEAGKMELAFDEVNIADVTNSVLSTMSGLTKDKPIQMKRIIEPNLPTVRADAIRVRQVMINLLSNAAKFTDEGDILVEVGLKPGLTGRNEVNVSVTDTGPGIAKQDQTKLFQAFSQVDDSPTRKTGGTGLGLSICQHIINMHGGRIWVDSDLGRGSTFHFTLPLFRKEKEGEPASVENKIILAIDDDPQVIGLYERYLRPQGYQVIPLSDPSQALERVKQVKPFAVTLDIMMPGIDGWQILDKLKNDPSTRNIPVIVCSIIEDLEKGFNLGATDYLVKPILEDDLVNALDRLNADGSIRDVLVIDDDPDDLRLIGKILTDDGRYKAILAEGGRMGWDIISSGKPPHAVILDLFMPEVDGFKILENMQTSQTLRDIPVIVISGMDLSTEQKNQLSEFGQRLLSKGSFNEKELLTSIQRSLERVHAKK
jgi:PAS domain S-box-containing protein